MLLNLQRVRLCPGKKRIESDLKVLNWVFQFSSAGTLKYKCIVGLQESLSMNVEYNWRVLWVIGHWNSCSQQYFCDYSNRSDSYSTPT